jgi:hypothetical protein
VANACIFEAADRIEELEGTSNVQRGFFNAAMDRAEKAEARVAELDQATDIIKALVEAWDDYREEESERGQKAMDGARRFIAQRKKFSGTTVDGLNKEDEPMSETEEKTEAPDGGLRCNERLDRCRKLARQLQTQAYFHGGIDQEDRWSNKRYRDAADNSDKAFDRLMEEIEQVLRAV